MKTIKNGTQFEVCNHKELLKKGWKFRVYAHASSKLYEHDDFACGGVITYMMIENYQGKTLTIIAQSINFPHWYIVKENSHLWPVATFINLSPFIDKTNPLWCIAPCVDAPCVEGQTAILGYIICKICGQNLRKIKVN